MPATPNAAKLRAWYAHRQGLDGLLANYDAAKVLAHAGWARSVGGCGPYFTLWSRAGIAREAAEHALRSTAIHELPCARGCTYVVPAEHYALALTVAQGFADEAAMKTARRVGVTGREVDKLQDGILAALKKGPLDPTALRDACGKLVRNLGEEGKKKGVTTTLPLALGFLQTQGRIRRIPVNGRLDTERYSYALWDPSPLAGFKLSRDDCFTELARLFFHWAGPAAASDFRAFSGLGVKASAAILDSLRLAPCTADGRLLLPADLEAFHSFKPWKTPHYCAISSLDSLTLLRRDLAAFYDGDPPALRGLADLPHHAFVDRGRIVGLWAFDPERSEIVTSLSVKPDAALRKLIAATESFVRDELGDAKSFSMDSPKSRIPKLAALRAAPQGAAQ